MRMEIIDFKINDTITLSPAEDTTYKIQLDGGSPEPKSFTVNLNKKDVSCRILCGYKLSEGQSEELKTVVVHQAPRTKSEIRVRCVLLDGGTLNYQGTIVMQKTSQGATSRLDDKTLVAGNGTRNHSEPVMQIEANDVTASHASSTGRVDENQLYYLQTRGLSSQDSLELLIKAFLTSANF